MRRMLVTGAAGFIGTNFVHFWAEQHSGDTIVGLDALTYAGNLANLEPLAKNERFTFVKGDIRDGDLVRDIISILDAEGVNASQFGLEITETTIMTDPEQALTTLRELDAMGIRLSIDDFGTGYSSLAYLRRLPVHEIKIDK